MSSMDEELMATVTMQWGSILTRAKLPAEVLATLGEGCKVQFVAADGKRTIEATIERIDTTERDERVQRLAFEGDDSKVFLIGNVTSAKLRTPNGEDFLMMDTLPEDYKTPLRPLPQYNLTVSMLTTLAVVIQEYEDQAFPKTYKERFEKVMKIPGPILQYLWEEWNTYQKDLRRILRPDAIAGVVKNS